MSLKLAQRITCDEEERRRLGYELVAAYRFPDVGSQVDRRDAEVHCAGGGVLRLSYGDATDLYRVNLGWLNQGGDQPRGFNLDLERGYWSRNQADSDDRDDAANDGRIARVVPFVRDTRNAVVMRFDPPWSGPELKSLQAAFKEAIQRHFQLEPRELAAEAMPSRDDQREILFYEASEGGAGVLRQLAEDPAVVPALARRALEVCHYAPDTLEDLAADRCGRACYECLLDYGNQPDHRHLDRALIRDLLAELSHADCRPAGGAGTRAQRLDALRNRCDSGLEGRWLDMVDSLALRLPSDAQYGIPQYRTRPDLFRSRSDLAAEGWRLSGNVFRRNGEEHLPLYEGKMVHQFDHRWQTWDGGERRDLTVLEKQSPDSTVLPRHWVQAREVYLRIAELPRGLLDALRNRDQAAILFCVAHLLFAQWLRRDFGESAERASRKIFPAWMAFVAHHPFARAVAMAGMVSSLADASACIQPLDRSYVPALALDELTVDELDIDELSRTRWWTRKAVRDSGAVWYAAEHDRVSVLLKCASDNRHLCLPAGSLREADAAFAYAEDLLVRMSPRWLVGCRDVTASTDSRTVICSAFPASAVGHKLPVWRVSGEHVHVFPSILCSFACDFAARLKLGGKSLAFFVAKQIPVLPPTTLSSPAPWLATESPRGAIRDWLVPRILELTYTADHLETFARECGWTGPPFRWDEERRFLLRCELDAAFFHLYLPSDDRGDWRPARRADACPHDETSAELDELRAHFSSPRAAVGYVMDTFLIVRRKDEERFGQYRTKDVILEIYDALQEAVATGTSYRTRLDPAPADLRCCHPPRSVAVASTVPELAVLPDGAWARPVTGDRTPQEVAVLAAVLKEIGAPAPIRRVRLAVLLAMEPRLLTPSLSRANEEEWRRLVGPEAEPLPGGVSPLRRSGHAWGAAVRQLRGANDLLEDLEEKTWARGPALDAIETAGWPDGRVGMVLDVLDSRGDDEIVRTLPQYARVWIDEAA